MSRQSSRASRLIIEHVMAMPSRMPLLPPALHAGHCSGGAGKPLMQHQMQSVASDLRCSTVGRAKLGLQMLAHDISICM